MDFPQAWAAARAVPYEEHEEKCSYRTTTGAVLCDCKVLHEHPDYDVPTTPPDPGWDRVAQEMHEEGFFASEQERVAEEAAWGDQVEQEQANLPAVIDSDSVPAVVDEAVDEPVNPLDIPDEYDLPMYGSIMMCPKCRGDRVRTTYHPHGVLSEPCGTRFGWPKVQNLGEHLCRTCTNCSYGWPEAVAHGAA